MVAHNLFNQSAQRTVFPMCIEQNLGVVNVFTVRNVFAQPRRLREVLSDLKARSLLNGGAIGEQDPLGWVAERSGAGSLVEAAYRYAAYTEPVSTVMNGTLVLHELEENVRNIGKGRLAQTVVEDLRDMFHRVAEPIGN